MDEALPQRIYQDENFIVNGFSGKKLEQLIAFAAVENPGDPIVVYLKAEDNHLQRFFLDAGIGCWEYTDDETMTNEKEAGYIYVDYAVKYNLQNKKISSIYCEKEQHNSRIVIALENKECIILRCKNAEIVDSERELFMTKDSIGYSDVRRAGRSSDNTDFLSINKESDYLTMNTRKLLEEKEWQYSVFEVGNTIKLSISIAKPNPGFDILYTLSESEKESYLMIGIKALENRIEDMKVNFSNYEMNSWR